MDTLRDEVYRRKLGHRGRGVHDLEQRVGPVIGDIDARLSRRSRTGFRELTGS